MTTILTIFLSLFHLVNTSPARAGAISAGGLQAPAKLECLFLDPALPLQPHNFIIYALGGNDGILLHVDLRTKKTLASHRFDELKASTSSGKLSYRGEARTSERLLVNIDRRNPLSYESFIPEFAQLADLKDVTIDKDAVGYRSALRFRGQSLSGICAEGPLFYYFVR